jgi:hypothetical protein
VLLQHGLKAFDIGVVALADVEARLLTGLAVASNEMLCELVLCLEGLGQAALVFERLDDLVKCFGGLDATVKRDGQITSVTHGDCLLFA